MHPSILEILEAHNLNDQTQYPTGPYALSLYRAVREELFPHLLAPPQPGAIQEFARLRKIFLPLGIKLVVADLQNPDPARLAAHLDKIAAYIEFRDQQIQDTSSLVNKCARKLYQLEQLSSDKQRVQQQLETVEAELASDRGQFSALQKQNRAEQSMIRTKYDECMALSARATKLQSLLAQKQKDLERTNASLATNRQAIETLRPYVNERTGVVTSAKSSIEQLQREIKQAKALQQTLLESNAQLESSRQALVTIETQIPALEEALSTFKQQNTTFQDAKREQTRLQTEADRKKRTLASLEETVANLELKIQQLRDQETKLRSDVANTAAQWTEATAAMEIEENKLMDEIGELRVSTDTVHQQLASQREYNQQVKHLLETAPQKLTAVEKELDTVLGEILRVKIEPPAELA